MLSYSVVIPWCDRPEVLTSLQKNREIYERHGAEIILVNAGGDYAALTALAATSGVANVRCIDLPGAAFNRSLCANVGALVSRGDVIFLLDVDIVFDSDVLAESSQYFENAAGRFVTIRRIIESDLAKLSKPAEPDFSFLEEMVETRELLTVDGRRAVLRNTTSPTQGRRTGDGLVMMKRRDMLEIGGWNSRLIGWGYEDTDFQLRLQFALGLERTEAGDVTHLTHGGGARDFESWRRNMATASKNYCNRNYKGSFDDDAQEWTGKLREAVAV